MRLTLATTAIMAVSGGIDMVWGKSIGRVMPRAGIDIQHAYRHTGYIDQQVRTNAHNILNHQLYHARQVDTPADSSSVLGSNPSGHAPLAKAVVPAASDMSRMVNPAPACMKALTAMNGVASNPSGIAVCYNVLMLNATTGVFQADVRLYRIAPPTGDWETLDSSPGKITTGLQYMGADVHTPSITPNKRRDVASLPDATAEVIIKRAAAPPECVKNLTYIAQAHWDVLPQLNNITIQEAMVTPLITLSGTIANGSVLTTMLSSADASFVSGLFQDSMTGNSTAAALAAAATLEALEKAEFVLPGTTLAIFPTGLIITGAWTFLFLCVVGYGTYGKIQFRESYRRRMKVRMATGSRTI